MTLHKFQSFYGKNPDRQTSGPYITFPITLSPFEFKSYGKGTPGVASFLWPPNGDLAYSLLNERLRMGISKILSTQCSVHDAIKMENEMVHFSKILSISLRCWCWQSKWRTREWCTWRIQRLTSTCVETRGQQLTSCGKTPTHPARLKIVTIVRFPNPLQLNLIL